MQVPRCCGSVEGKIDYLLVWVSESLVPQVEMSADASIVVDQPLLKVLLSLEAGELDGLSRVVAVLQSHVILSADDSELRALRDAEDASHYQWRMIDGEVVLTRPTADETDTWLARGLTEQVLGAPIRWRADVVAALSTLIADIEDVARRRRRRLLRVAVAAGAATAGLLCLGLRTIALRVRR